MTRQEARGGAAVAPDGQRGRSVDSGATSGDFGRVQTLIVHDFPSPRTFRVLSANGSHGHWAERKYHRDGVMGVVKVTADMQRLRPVHGPVRLTFRWGFPSSRKRDIDNLIGNGVTKAAIDALVEGKWLEADDSEHVVSIVAEVFRNPDGRRLEIVLEPAAPAHGRAEEC